MGSNMMRQAVPLLRSEAPIVGTGIERQLAHDSRTQLAAEGDGIVDFVDATTIRILYDRTDDADSQADPGSVPHTGKQVTPETVRSEPVHQRTCLIAYRCILFGKGPRAKKRHCNREYNPNAENNASGDRHAARAYVVFPVLSYPPQHGVSSFPGLFRNCRLMLYPHDMPCVSGDPAMRKAGR